MSRIRDNPTQRTVPAEQTNSPRDMLRAATAKSRQISVGIVGTGFAGLRCADILLQHGCKVTIFEARNRLGGRVAQSNHLGHSVDLGPNWIHSTADNPIMHLAKQSGTQLHAWDEEQTIYNTKGRSIDSAEAGEYAQLLWDNGVIADAFRYSKEHSASVPPDRSLYDFFAEKAETMFLDEPADEAKRKRETFLQTTKIWGAYVGSDVRKQSLKFFWLEECIEGENPFVAGTYAKILEAVAKPVREKADVRLETKVTRVVSDDGGGQHRKPKIETADGLSEEFDEVVVTCPLGWLKRNQDAFQPALPSRMSQAIKNIGYGTLDKVYITWPSAFWDTPQPRQEESTVANGVADPKGKTPNVTAASAPLHQAPSHEDNEQEHYPAFTHWLSPTYTPSTNPHGWDQQGMNLAALPLSCAHPTILFYIYGDCSAHIAHLASSSTSTQEWDAKLLSFFLPYYSLLPNYSPTNPSCQPKAILATAWTTDEFAGYGSYSNFQVGLENGDEDVEVMRYGMPERGVWFAGEHTAPFVALGTSTGAYWSGEGVAGRIVKAYDVGGETSR